MDIAVLSDIHGNYIALERCLQEAFSRDISTFFFLGDYIGELAYPERTMQRLYDLSENYQCYFIKGNKEEYWLKYRADGETGWKDQTSGSGALVYAYNCLTDRDLEFFSKLEPTMEIMIDRMTEISICHGSPYKINEKLSPGEARTIEVMESVKAPIILCGHSHVQNKIVHKGKCVLNPGSVGVPIFSGGKTQFLILHVDDEVQDEGKSALNSSSGQQEHWREEFISLDYDIERVIRDMHEVKLYKYAPYWCVITESILRGGNITHGDILPRVMELCRQDTGDCIWPDIPEKYWAQGVAEMLGL